MTQVTVTASSVSILNIEIVSTSESRTVAFVAVGSMATTGFCFHHDAVSVLGWESEHEVLVALNISSCKRNKDLIHQLKALKHM